MKDLTDSVNIGKVKSCWKPRRFTFPSIIGPLLAKIAGKEIKSPEAMEEEEEETPSNELKLLNNVTARFKRGHMTALMGQSGAGKKYILKKSIHGIVVESHPISIDFPTA